MDCIGLNGLRMLAVVSCWLGLFGISESADVPAKERNPNALGSEWQWVMGDIHFNLRTIRPSVGGVRAWWLSNKSGVISGKPYNSRKTLGEFDCITEKLRFISSVSYSRQNGLGDTIDSYEYEDAPWSLITPSTMGEHLWKIACSIGSLHGIAPSKWTKVYIKDGLALYVAASTHTRDGDFAKISTLMDFPKAMPFQNNNVLSSKDRYELDCVERRIRREQGRIWYSEKMGRGNIVYIDTFEEDIQSWGAVDSGTPIEAILKFACSTNK